MAKINAEEIVKRHSKFPEATIQLIEYYANMKVKEHIDNLLKMSAITNIYNTNVVIVADLEIWQRFKNYDLFSGLDIKILEKSDMVCSNKV